MSRSVALGAISLLFAAIAAGVSAAAWTPQTLLGLHYKAVLIAGEASVPAFDHATETMRDLLLASQVPPADIQRLSASHRVVAQGGIGVSSLDQVLSSIERLHPAAGEGCLVFATSHGAYQEGLVLAPSESFLTPAALDHALVSGCGDAPTAVIISGCFSGGFTRPPMARANRIILTAAREDRPSFGCGAEFQYTVYDRCLLRAMERATIWHAAFAMIRTCVTAEEKALRFPASEPRAWFGEAVPGLPVPHRP